MAGVKPGLESEQQEEDDGRETKEGWSPPVPPPPMEGCVHTPPSALSSLPSCCWSNTIACVCHHMQYAAVSDGRVACVCVCLCVVGGGVIAGASYQASGMLGVSVD